MSRTAADSCGPSKAEPSSLEGIGRSLRTVPGSCLADIEFQYIERPGEIERVDILEGLMVLAKKGFGFGIPLWKE